jgi:hypothetical protein
MSSDPNDLPPIPKDFGFKYILWWIWCHAIFLLSIVQAVFAAFLLVADDPTNPILPHNVYRWIIFGNAVLTTVLAKVERKMPPLAQPPETPAK